ncbi:uncharacterized protein LOC118435390 [Folsomia candida]|uniref:uncharacterized protein LOC118435390 n=1 Tax=Folsomia candida TaxID=158441 RepID=UPI001604D3DF|nr:uncharacterized protein LOC118435390 [Folsomia candida]
MTWHTATRIYDTELREEDQAILEALMKWEDLDNDNNPMGIPNWARFRNKKRSSDDKDDKDSENSEDEDSDEEKSVEEEMGEDQDFGDILTSLENKPDQYNNLLKKMDGERCFGDTKYYCPVTFVEENLLRKGSPQFAAKYRYRLYYCADEVTLQKFLNNPMNYLSEGEPHSPPPPRICITGSPGCGQEAVGLQLAKQYNICYINFRQRLHELTKARLGREVGPNKTGDIVTRYESEKLISKCKSGDDIIKRKNKNTTEVMNEDGEVISEQEEEVEEDTEYDEEEEEVAKVEGQELDDDDEDDDIARKITRDSKLTLHPVLDETKSEELKINEAALRSLGLLEAADLKTVPIGSVERTERLTERKWKKLTKIETYAQAFLENGIQLPDIVLDEYVLPLFKEAPFNQVGFIMVGFPNTDEDIAYLVKRNILPEAVFVMECEQLVIRNRLLRDAVDKWHIERNPTGRKKKRLSQIHGNKILPLSKSRMRIALGTAGSGDFHQTGFEYQSEGRPVIDEYEEETWTYNDTISSMITMALKHYHTIFSKDIRTMKMSLNKNRVDWLSINTNPDLFGAKSKLEKIMSRLKNR